VSIAVTCAEYAALHSVCSFECVPRVSGAGQCDLCLRFPVSCAVSDVCVSFLFCVGLCIVLCCAQGFACFVYGVCVVRAVTFVCCLCLLCVLCVLEPLCSVYSFALGVCYVLHTVLAVSGGVRSIF